MVFLPPDVPLRRVTPSQTLKRGSAVTPHDTNPLPNVADRLVISGTVTGGEIAVVEEVEARGSIES